MFIKSIVHINAGPNKKEFPIFVDIVDEDGRLLTTKYVPAGDFTTTVQLAFAHDEIESTIFDGQ